MTNKSTNAKKHFFWRWLRLILEIIAVCTIAILAILFYLVLEDSDSRLGKLDCCSRERVALHTINNIISPFNIVRHVSVPNGAQTIDTVYIQADGVWQRIGQFNGEWQQFATGQLTTDEFTLITQPFHEDGSVHFSDESGPPDDGEYIYYVESKLKPAARHYSFTCPEDISAPSAHCQLAGKLFD